MYRFDQDVLCQTRIGAPQQLLECAERSGNPLMGAALGGVTAEAAIRWPIGMKLFTMCLAYAKKTGICAEESARIGLNTDKVPVELQEIIVSAMGAEIMSGTYAFMVGAWIGGLAFSLSTRVRYGQPRVPTDLLISLPPNNWPQRAINALPWSRAAQLPPSVCPADQFLR